jgi:hypothetical protein
LARRAGEFRRVGEALSAFIALGCELRVAEATVHLDDGDVLNVRYLLNPATGAFVPLVDLEDDEQVSAAEVRFWERRLGLTLPR